MSCKKSGHRIRLFGSVESSGVLNPMFLSLSIPRLEQCKRKSYVLANQFYF